LHKYSYKFCSVSVIHWLAVFEGKTFWPVLYMVTAKATSHRTKLVNLHHMLSCSLKACFFYLAVLTAMPWLLCHVKLSTESGHFTFCQNLKVNQITVRPILAETECLSKVSELKFGPTCFVVRWPMNCFVFFTDTGADSKVQETSHRHQDQVQWLSNSQYGATLFISNKQNMLLISLLM